MSNRSPRLSRRLLLGGGLAVTAVGAIAPTAFASGTKTSRSAAPPIYGTDDWQARSPNGTIQVLDSSSNKIIVHHTATPNSEDTSKDHAFALSRSIQNHHMDNNGWTDTGQHFTNTRGGYLTEGRHKSLDALGGGSEHVVGAHVSGQNSVALGIENEGTYTDASVPDALWSSLVELCSYMVSQYGIAAGDIYGHRDYNATACPGDVLYSRLPELRDSVATATGSTLVTPVTWPLLQPGTTGPRVAAAQHLLRVRGHGAVPVNGVFDTTTQAAADAFLTAHGFHDPYCYATRVVEPGLFGGTAWTALAPVLHADSHRSEAVRAAQILLTSCGHGTPTTARFDSRTVSTVRDFQATNNLETNGILDHQTWKHLLR